MEKEISNLIRCLKSGVSSMMVVTGTLEEMRPFRAVLLDMLVQEGFQPTELDLTDGEQRTTQDDSEREVDLLIVWGLERLSPQDNRTYALRSFLDRAQHQGLKSIMFCETAAYRPHFSDYDAPFYHFCLRHPIRGSEIKPNRPT